MVLPGQTRREDIRLNSSLIQPGRHTRLPLEGRQTIPQILIRPRLLSPIGGRECRIRRGRVQLPPLLLLLPLKLRNITLRARLRGEKMILATMLSGRRQAPPNAEITGDHDESHIRSEG